MAVAGARTIYREDRAVIAGDGTDLPDVSIVICTRNRAPFLSGTLRALAAIRSKYQWEVLMVDNASTDDTKAVVTSADDCGGRLRYNFAGQIGLGAARDNGWRLARGRIVAFTDDDCYPESSYVDRIVEVFAENPGTGCVGGRILLYDVRDARVTIDERDAPETLTQRQYVRAGTLHGANLAILRSALERIGGFDAALGAGSRFKAGEDADVVAATLWAGLSVRFDPRPVVWHHHRRREADLGRLHIGYDRGRGAYLAKYVLRSDTRLAYATGWWSQARNHRSWSGIVHLARELSAAAEYIWYRRAYLFLAGFVLLSLPLFFTVVLRVIAVTAFRLLKKPLGLSFLLR